MIKNSIKKPKGIMNQKIIEKFLKDNEIKKNGGRNKQDYIEAIENFASESPQNKEIVDNWIDNILKEGIKHIYVTKIIRGNFEQAMNTYEYWEQFLINKDFGNLHLNDIDPKINLKYESIKINKNGENVDSVELVLAQKICNLDDVDEDLNVESRREAYYVFVDINLVNNILIIRGTPKSRIWSLQQCEEHEQIKEKIAIDKIFIQTIQKLETDIGLKRKNKDENHVDVCRAYYKILEELIEIPQEIKEQLNKAKDEKFEDVKKFLKGLGIELERFESKIDEDIDYMLEKFISISHPDKEVFKNKYGYPIKLIATDSENTRVEETSSNCTPLQIKAAFYDHKKIIIQEKSCNGIYLYINRKESKIFNSGFIAKLDWYKGVARIRVEEYVEKEDIENVLSRIAKFL